MSLETIRADRTAKANAMAGLYRRGKTLAEVGAIFGVTRERVRQLIKRIGVTSDDGGHKQRARDRKARAKAESIKLRDARTQAVYGCDWAVAVALNGGVTALRSKGITGAYYQHRRNAINHGTEWHFTLPLWLQTWQASGHFHERGRAGDSYVMARYGDAGPYSPSNVYITTLRTNSRDCRMHCLGRLPSYAQVVSASSHGSLSSARATPTAYHGLGGA